MSNSIMNEAIPFTRPQLKELIRQRGDNKDDSLEQSTDILNYNGRKHRSLPRVSDMTARVNRQ